MTKRKHPLNAPTTMINSCTDYYPISKFRSLDLDQEFVDLLDREYQDDHPGGDPSIKSEEVYPDW